MEPDLRDPTNTLLIVYQSKVSDKGFDGESRPLLVLLKFGGFEHRGTKSSHHPEEELDGTIPFKKPRRRGSGYVKKVPPVLEVPRRVRDTGTRASAKRTLRRGVEAVREGIPQSVSFDTPFQTSETELSVKMNSFIEQDENAMNPKGTIPGTDICSEEEQKMAWMRKTRIRTFMQVKLEAYRDGSDWLIRCHNCAAYICPEEEYPPRPLPIPPDYIDNLQSRLGKEMKGILPPTLNMILEAYHQAPVRPQQQEISSCSQEKQLTTSLEVQPDDMTGKHRDGEYNPWERP